MSANTNPTTLELTEVETTLRQLLLDVASYIDASPVPEPVDSEVKLPDELAKTKIELRFTGGWVRDKLLGVGSHDIDVAINKMTGYQFGLKMKEYLETPGNSDKYELSSESDDEKAAWNRKGREVAKGFYKIEANPEKSKHLETVTTKILGLDIDLVNLRKETYSEDSRNPQMEFGTPEEDALRRDATVNAMFYNLRTSLVEDFTGQGFKDMQLKIIRTPLEPYQTFKDDPLRVLRLIRFASRLNYTIHPETEKAMENKDIKEALKLKISRERVGIEMEKTLKGPDPHMALGLVDRLGLYETIFTDPTKENAGSPELSYFKPAYDCVLQILGLMGGEDNLSVIPSTLLRDSEEKYLAWISAVLIPWADAPTPDPPKPTAKPLYVAQQVAREGIKAPNKVCDVIAASIRYSEEIRTLKDQCVTQIRYPHRKEASEDATARDTLGMAIRRWGPTWRSQVLFSLLYEVALGSIPKSTIISSYATFLTHLTKLEILDAYAFKPLLTGTELAKALSTRPGPWMKDALDVVMAWQLLHPDITDPSSAIKAVEAQREGSSAKEEPKPKANKSELPARLTTHFLSLTIRPLFASSQNHRHPHLTPAGRKAAIPKSHPPHSFTENHPEPWKDPREAYALDLLRWVLRSVDAKGVEANWGLLVPPILRLLDDLDTAWKATGCELLTLLLQATPPPLLARTGLGNVFEESLMPLLTYLPPLTSEPEAIVLLDRVYPALLTLVDVMYPATTTLTTKTTKMNTPSPPTSNTRTRDREKFLDALFRHGILSPLSHTSASASTQHVRTTSLILSHLLPLLSALGVQSVKHLQHLTPLLSSILSEPLGPAYPPLLLAAAKAMQSVVLNAWPRVGAHRGEVLRGVCVCWVRLGEEGEGKRAREEGLGLDGVRRELRGVVEMLGVVLKSVEGVDFKSEVGVLVGADERLGGLFEGGVDGEV